MSDTEKAWKKWEHDEMIWCLSKDEQEIAGLNFRAGHAVASADTERLVRAAVEATRGEAAHELEPTLRYWLVAPIVSQRILERIRALDIDAIVARVMASSR